jgi:hypothetical protein
MLQKQSILGGVNKFNNIIRLIWPVNASKATWAWVCQNGHNNPSQKKEHYVPWNGVKMA